MDKKEQFKPFIPAESTLPEFTPTAIILGLLLAVVFGGANAYLGLRVGMTVSASIPAAVISMGVIRVILKKDSVLENNIVQTIGSAGESVAAGAIFTLPALFLWANEWGTEFPSLIEITLIAIIGGCLGILFMVPLRKALIVKEHDVLPYPEGKACAKVLLAGEDGGAKAGLVFKGLGISAIYKFITDGLKLFPSEIHYEIKPYAGAGIGADVLPALLGVGYICGAKISSYLFAGGIGGWLVLMPTIVLFGSNEILFPSVSETIGEIYAQNGSWGIWSNYIKYIGAGAVATGGFISLIKSLPLIFQTFIKAIRDYGKETDNTDLRTNQDLPMSFILISILLFALLLWLIPVIPVNLFCAFLIVIFGFFFATVSSRMVGLIGSSNNPVSGMTIATILISSILLKLTGQTGREGMIAAIAIGSVICIIAAIAGDTSQDLKTGFLVGSTPKYQQIGELIGVTASATAIGAILYLLNSAWPYGSQQLPAAQATLMKMIVEGVMGGNLPWTLIFIGVFIGIAVEILGIPVLPFAVGLYLPIHLSVPMMIGGAVRWLIDNKKQLSETNRISFAEDGVLFCSGLIAGEGLIGILLAILAVIPAKTSGSVGDRIGTFMSRTFFNSNAGGILFFLILTFMLLKITYFKKKRE